MKRLILGIVPWLIKRRTVMLRRPVIRVGGLGVAIALGVFAVLLGYDLMYRPDSQLDEGAGPRP